MALDSLGKVLVMIGGSLALLGLLLIVLGKATGTGRLPGDIVIQRGNVTFYFPLLTMLLASLVLSIVATLVLRWFRG
ncbi:MAG: DUF2905 domain-containing protein [Chloroflexi bacterium]|nr:DUF2905 domain-containing protein [Chloroflexota bacterium]